MKVIGSYAVKSFLLVALISLVFSSCENFMSGDLLKERIEDEIEYSNASPTKVTISALKDATELLIPSTGTYSYKKGDPIELNFTVSNSYKFLYWKAEPATEVKFNDYKSPETVARLVNYTDAVSISPVCVQRPAVEKILPQNVEGGVCKNSSIKITFNKPLYEKIDLSRIAITVNGDSIKNNFYAPVIDSDGKTVIFRANKNLIELTAGTKIVNVRIPGDFYCVEENNKIEIGSDIEYSYIINSTTNEKAKVAFELSDINSGTMSPNTTNSQPLEYNWGTTESVKFTVSDNWKFFGWSAENGNGIVEIEDSEELKTNIRILDQSEDIVVIRPIVFEKVQISGFEPEDKASGVERNSTVKIKFSKPISKDNDLSKIKVTMDGKNVYQCFTPVLQEDCLSINLISKKDNLLDIKEGVKTVEVVIPADFYYMSGDYKVEQGEDKVFSYKVNSATNEKVTIAFNAESGSGQISQKGSSVYYLDDEITVSFIADARWQAFDWNIENGTGVVDIISKNESQLKLKVLNQSTQTVTVSPVVYKRLEVTGFKPEYQSQGVPKNSNIEIEFNNELSQKNITDDILSKISVLIDSEDMFAAGAFSSPVIDENDSKKIIIEATRSFIDVSKGTKNVNVVLPSDLCYEIDEKFVTLGSEYKYIYRVNSESNEKTTVNILRPEGAESGSTVGSIEPAGKADYNLDEIIIISYELPENYKFIGWEPVDTSCVELIPESGQNYDENGYNSKTRVATVTVKVVGKSNTVIIIKPIISEIPWTDIEITSKYGRFSSNGSGRYREGFSQSISFTSDPDYQFIRWQIIDKKTNEELENWTEDSGGYIYIDDVTNANSSFTLKNAPAAEAGVKLAIEPLCAKRPKIVSYSPQYTTAGDMRDRTLVVMFNSKMDESSIYYTADELKSLGVVDSNKNPIAGYTLLGSLNNGDCYGYYKNSDPDNSIVFKNIRICKLNDQSVNLLKYYGKPVFDKGNTGILRIPTKITDESKQTDEAPPKYTEILVTLETGINTKNNDHNVYLSEEFSWAYFTNTITDSNPPEFDNENIKILIADKDSSNYYSVKDNTSLAKFNDSAVSITDEVSNIKKYNPKEGYIWVEMSITDEGSGVNVVNGIFTKIHNQYYPNESGEDEILTDNIHFTLSGSANNATISEKINLKDFGLTEGLYTLSFKAVDKNDHTALSEYEYQFIYDNEAPKAIEVKEIRKQAEKSSLFWTNPQEKDFASVTVVSKNIDQTETETEPDHENSFKFDSSSYKTGIQYENFIPGLKPYKHYSHKLIISDYAGNETEVEVPVDNDKPAKITGLIESRTVTKKATISWTKPTEADFGKVVIKRVNKTAEEKDETPEEDTVEVSRTDSQSIIYTAKDFYRYEYTATVVDYSGNESEAVTITDRDKPAKIKSFNESRIQSGKATLTWTKPSEADFGKVVIKRVNKTAAENNETPEEDTVEVLSTDSQSKIYTAKDFYRYEYTATVVDYSGNESEPELITDIIPPKKVGSLTEVRSSRTNAKVSWTCDSDVGKVTVARYKADGTKESSNDVLTKDKKYIDYTTLVNGVRYVYKVTTTDYSGNTNEEIVDCTDTKAPSKVSSVTNKRESANYETITWTKPSDSDFDHVRIVQYDLKTNSKVREVNVEKTNSSNEFSGLTDQHKYKYLVYTVDFAGNENASYYSFQDDSKPSPVTDIYSGGRNDKIEIYFDVPANKKMSHVELSGSYNENLSISSSGANDFKKSFTGIGNGVSKSFTLKVKDFSGNESTAVSFTDVSGAGVGKICHTPTNGQDALCSVNVYKNKNPVGVVCKDSDYGNIFIWDLYEYTGFKWSEYGFPCSDDSYWKNNGLYKDDNLWVVEVNSSNETLNSVTSGTGKWKTANRATGLQWLEYINNNYSDLAKSDNVWGFIKEKNRNSTSVTWFMPSILEFEHLLNSYDKMENSYKLLSNNGYSNVTLVTASKPYWTGTPRYIRHYAYVGMFKERTKSGCDWMLFQNSSSTLKRFYITSDRREDNWYYKNKTYDEANSTVFNLITHAMGSISMW